MSIINHIHQDPESLPRNLELLYTHRLPFTPPEMEGAPVDPSDSVLFLERLRSLFASRPFSQGPDGQNAYRFTLFLTSSMDSKVKETPLEALESQERITKQHTNKEAHIHLVGVPLEHRRVVDADLLDSVKDMTEQERKGIVAYVCGPPSMTDWAVGTLRKIPGVVGERVLCEKWW